MATAVVTGASSGLGREIASLLAARGERVVAVARSRQALDELATSSPRIEAIAADLSNPGERSRIVDAVGDVDILVNNAGLGAAGLVVEAPADVTNAMVAVNVAALTDLTARWLPAMVAHRSGRVLNVASTAAFQPGPRMAVYFATKAYVLSLTEALAEELRGTGV
jgi:short-subunit dehydrogenase